MVSALTPGGARRPDTPGAQLSVGIISLGLIGGSIALRLREQGITVFAWNPSPGALEQAAHYGVQPTSSIADLCAQRPDVLILANPLRAMAHVIGEVAGAVQPGTVITDVGSVKGPIAELIAAAGLSERFVGAHPMAGTEATGFAAADPGILAGARWALAVEAKTQDGAFARIVHLVTGLLGGVVHAVDSQTHDEAAALISHVPHVLATELLNMVARAPVRDLALALAAGSFRDGTRVGHTDPRRTESMVVENAAWVAPALRVVIRDLEMLVAALESNGSTAEFFDTASEVRAARREEMAAATDALSGPGASHASSPEPVEIDLAHADWRTHVLDAGARAERIVGVDVERMRVRVER